MASTPQDKRYRGAHDPYNNMEEADIRPKDIARQEFRFVQKALFLQEKYNGKGNCQESYIWQDLLCAYSCLQAGG